MPDSNTNIVGLDFYQPLELLNILNALNTQAAKDLADAKLKAAELERLLREAKRVVPCWDV